MTTKTIPEARIVTCDVCQRVCKADGVNRWVHGGHVKVIQHALDLHGNACASANAEFDLCDACLPKVTGAINRVALEVRAVQAPA